MYIKKIVILIALVGVFVSAIFAYYVYDTVLGKNTAFTDAYYELKIPTNADFYQVLPLLDSVLDNVDSFTQTAKRKGYIDHVKPGRFLIPKGANNNEIVNILRSKNTALKLSFNNQESLAKLAGRIATQIEPDSLTLYKAFTNDVSLKEKGFNKQTALAMYLPNTYEVYWNTSAKSFVGKMYRNYKNFWNLKRISQAKSIGLTPLEVITLASIVHKETTKVDERPRVAGVYMNRLLKKQKLQADPTVIYAVKHKTKDWDKQIKRVLFKHLEIDDPYNTYKHVGLPPGPIAMPDLSAINAVLNYEKHQYYYFVADTKRFGYHKFAKTHNQHIRNKKQYSNWISKYMKSNK